MTLSLNGNSRVEHSLGIGNINLQFGSCEWVTGGRKRICIVGHREEEGRGEKKGTRRTLVEIVLIRGGGLVGLCYHISVGKGRGVKGKVEKVRTP